MKEKISAYSNVYIALVLIAAVSKVLGFIRETLTARFFGADAQIDAFLVATTIPVILPAFIGAVLTVSFIPVYHKIAVAGGREECLKFANNIINITVAVLAVIMAVSYCFVEELTALISPGFAPSTLSLAAGLSYITFPAIVVSGVITFATGMFHCRNNFLTPALVSLVYNIMLIVFIFIAARLGIIWMALGSTIGMVFQMLASMYFLVKAGFRWRPVVDLQDENLLALLRVSVPIAMGITVNQINFIIDKILGSGLLPGTIAVLNYALKLNNALYALFILTLASLMYPTFSRLAAAGEDGRFLGAFERSSGILLFLSLPLALFTVYEAGKITELIFMRGAFNQEMAEKTADALRYFAAGLPAIGLAELANRACFSYRLTRIPLYAGLASVAANIAVSLILMSTLQHGALAVGASAGAVLQAGILIFYLSKVFGAPVLRCVQHSLLKKAAAGFLAMAAPMLVQENLLIDFAAFLIAYTVFARLAKCEELSYAAGYLRELKLKLSGDNPAG